MLDALMLGRPPRSILFFVRVFLVDLRTLKAKLTVSIIPFVCATLHFANKVIEAITLETPGPSTAGIKFT